MEEAQMTVLVAAASRHGATQEIAEAIAETLEAQDIPVEVARIEDVVTVFPYDSFVLGSAIYMGNWLRPARRFLDEHVEIISSSTDVALQQRPHRIAATRGGRRYR